MSYWQLLYPCFGHSIPMEEIRFSVKRERPGNGCYPNPRASREPKIENFQVSCHFRESREPDQVGRMPSRCCWIPLGSAKIFTLQSRWGMDGIPSTPAPRRPPDTCRVRIQVNESSVDRWIVRCTNLRELRTLPTVDSCKGYD